MCAVYIYVVDRDFGFAPNPFHGSCTLATCKPRIRKVAVPGDWVIGVGGTRLKATGKCVFAMKVTERMSFDDYWNSDRFRSKRPTRNGSAVSMLGDNVYTRRNGTWVQADSHHSHGDGSTNLANLAKDTSTDFVLASTLFYYFGSNAPLLPTGSLSRLGYRNNRGHRRFSCSEAEELLNWLKDFAPNYLHGDPHDFSIAHARYTGVGSKILTE